MHHRGKDQVRGAVGRPRPTLVTAAPFFVVGAIGLATVLAPPYDDLVGVLPELAALVLVAVVAAAVAVRRSRASWIDPWAPWLFFAILALARHATGGSSSGLALLVVLPILWLAMTGSRRQLHVATVLTGVLFVGPILLVGAPTYPPEDWRRAVLWVLFSALVAPAVQRVVHDLAAETERARTASAQMDGITRNARLSSMIATDLDGTVRMFSRGSEEMLGFRADEVVGRITLDELHDPAELVAVAAELGIEETGFGVLRELAHRGAPSRIWIKLRRDGTPVHTRLVLTTLTDDDGVPTGYLGVAIDATEGVRLVARLSRAEARWRTLMDHIPDLTVIVLDDEGVIDTVAGVGALRQGMTGHEGERLADVSRPQNYAVLAPALTAAVAGTKSVVEIDATASGAPHQVAMLPLPPEDGEPRVLLVARNVEQERHDQQELVRAKQWAEQLLEDSPHGVAVLTLDGRVVQANRALRALLGDESDDLTGADLTTCSPDQPHTLREHLHTALEHRGEMVEGTWTVTGAVGTTLHLSLRSRVLDEQVDGHDIALVNIVDMSERHRYEQRLTHLADHDVLTGLANRRAFDLALEKHRVRCERHGATGALLLLDLDHFKEVNDTLGHGAGDQLLVAVSTLLRTHVRSGDLVARLGGDEFAVLLPEADEAGAAVVAAALVECIRAHTSTLDGTRRRVTASIGAVMFDAVGQHEMDPLALVDMTMYDAKDAGRDQYAMLGSRSSRRPRLGARLEWRRRIEAALANDAFTLHLQPILDVQAGVIRSAEALVRLDDSAELVSPAVFLDIAERSDQIIDIDAWVVRHAIEMLAELRRTRPDFELEVNLSGLSIGSPVIEAAIVEALTQHGVEPSALILEITETAAVADVAVARQFAERMTALGCRFALDDFGAGFGSFYYLKHLLFDYVKIDGEFVADCHRSSVDRMIMRSTVGIARGLGKRTVAEFVTGPEILAVVRAEGIELAQGYHIGEPVPLHEFVERHLSLALPAPA